MLSNALDPGRVPTRMGGPGAPYNHELGHVTQAWLAVSTDPAARTSGGYWYHQRQQPPHPAVRDAHAIDLGEYLLRDGAPQLRPSVTCDPPPGYL